MARVNHKQIKKLIAQKVKTVRDRQLFTSPGMAAHLADIAAAQTRRYHFSRRVRVKIIWEPKQTGFLGVTNDDVVLLNAGHPLVTKNKDRIVRYNTVLGMFAHELGHILYSDFLMAQTYGLKMTAGKWYPEKPLLRNSDERRHEADLWDYCNQDENKKNAFLRMAHNIWNILEDGYIESKMLDRYPGKLGMSLKGFRDMRFEECPTLTQRIEAEEEPGGHIWLTIMQLFLSYVLWGEIKYGEEPLSDERVQVVFSLLPELDKALINPDPRERWHVTNTILVRCWPYIKDFLEMAEEMAQEESESGESASSEGKVSELISKLAGSSQEGTGSSTPMPEKPGSTHQPSSAEKRAATAEQAAAAGSQPEEPEDENKPESQSGEEENEQPEEKNEEDAAPVAEPESGDEPADFSGAPGSDEVQNVTSDEGGRFPLENTTTLSAPVGGSVQRDDDYEGTGYADAANDIERLLEQMAEKAVHKDLEKKRITELNTLANEISYGDIHSGVEMKIRRIADVDEERKDQYHTAAPSLLKISKKLQKSILQQLQDKRRGGKQTNLYSGRKLHIHALPRNDGKAFYNRKLPNNTPELAIALLLDESGSMGWGDRATYARGAAIILYDFCQSLGIPIAVYGHSTGSGEVDLYSYAEFDAIDRDDKYRMMDISSRRNNRDGAALRYTMEQLAKRPEDIRLLILVSDGQPADSGYGGTAAEADLRGVKKDCERKGVLLVAAAIGDDKPNIERIYSDSFMDITDLEKMPQKLTQMVKRHIRV